MEKILMNEKEAAKYLRLSLASLRRYRAAKIIPFMKLIGAIRYERGELDTWLENHSIGVS